jgi:hypothetical protein
MIVERQQVFIALLLALHGVAFASTDAWLRFSSSHHFSVAYPATWFRIGGSTDRLQILSSKGGAEGVIIRHGQAEIVVMEAYNSSKTLPQIIDYYTQGVPVLSRRDVPNEPGKEGCGSLEEVISKEGAVPSADSPIRVPNIINTDFFCEVNGLKLVTLLRNWEGDERQAEYEDVALRMAKSIRGSQ